MPRNWQPAPVHRVTSSLVRRLLQICTTVTVEALKVSDVTSLQFGALSYLYDEPDLDQNGLGARLGIDPSNSSLLADQLESKGFITRRVNEENRRAKQLRLTSMGRSFIERHRPIVRRANARILAPLKPQERQQFLDMLLRVVEENKAHARPGTGRRKRKTQSQGRRTS